MVLIFIDFNVFFTMRVLLVYVINVHVFMFLAPCSNVHYDFRIQTMLDSSQI